MKAETRIVKSFDPAFLGVPETTPVELFRVKPVGKAPLRIEKWYGAIPPTALIVPLKALPCVALPRCAVTVNGAMFCRLKHDNGRLVHNALPWERGCGGKVWQRYKDGTATDIRIRRLENSTLKLVKNLSLENEVGIHCPYVRFFGELTCRVLDHDNNPCSTTGRSQ